MSTKSGTYETCASYSNPSIVSRIHKIRTMGLVASEITSYNHKRHQDIIRCPPYYTVRHEKGDKKILGFYGWRQPHHVAELENFLGGSVNTFLCNFYIYYQI